MIYFYISFRCTEFVKIKNIKDQIRKWKAYQSKQASKLDFLEKNDFYVHIKIKFPE